MLTRRSALVVGVVAMALLSDAAQAQSYPDHPVKIVVPSPPAGSYDILGRVVADQLTRAYGTVVRGGKPDRRRHRRWHQIGGDGRAGWLHASGWRPEQHDFQRRSLQDPAFTIRSPFRPGRVEPEHFLFAGRLRQLAEKSVAEIVAAAKQIRARSSWRAQGLAPGSTSWARRFRLQPASSSWRCRIVGRRRCSPISFPVALTCSSTHAGSAALHQIGAGEGCRDPGRETPSGLAGHADHDQSGVPGFEIDLWIGIFAPAKTPPAIIARLQREIAAAGPEMKARFANVGGELMDIPPEKIAAVVRATTTGG